MSVEEHRKSEDERASKLAPMSWDRVSNPSLRIAAIIDAHAVSGPGRQLTALAQALDGLGTEMRVFLFHHDGHQPSRMVRNLESAGVACVQLRNSWRFDVGAITRLSAALRTWKPDVVQTHSYRATAMIWALKRTGLSARWIAFLHGTTAEDTKVRVYHWLDRHLAASADRVVVMSKAQQRLCKGDPAKVDVIYNAVVPLDRASSAIAPPAVVRPVFGVLGRLSKEKGVDIFVGACSILRKQGHNFSAIIVGDGPEHRRLLSLIQTLGLGDIVRVHPSTSAVHAVYSLVDAVVIPSRSEGLPNVLLEALGEDLPVVATDVGAVPEILTNPDAGVVVPSGDPAALAEGMVRALTHGHTASAREARRECTERLSLDIRVARHLDMYRDVIAGRQSIAYSS